jgi:hypothetical protein
MFTFKYSTLEYFDWTNSIARDDTGALIELTQEEENELAYARSHVNLPKENKKPLTEYLSQMSTLKTQRPAHTAAHSEHEHRYGDTLDFHDPLGTEFISTSDHLSTPYYYYYEAVNPSNYDEWKKQDPFPQYDARICKYQLAEWIQLKLLNMARDKECIKNFIQYIGQYPNACIDKITFMTEILLRENKFFEFLELYDWAKTTYDVNEYYTSRELATLLVNKATFTPEPNGGKIILEMEEIEYQSQLLSVEEIALFVKFEVLPPGVADPLALYFFTLGLFCEEEDQRPERQEHFERLFHFGLQSEDKDIIQCCQRAATALTDPQIKCASMADNLLLDVKFLDQSSEALIESTKLIREKQMIIDAQAKEIKELRVELEKARAQASINKIPDTAPSFFSAVAIDNVKKIEPTAEVSRPGVQQ